MQHSNLSSLSKKVDTFFRIFYILIGKNCRSVSGNSIADHLTYYGVEMGCNESSNTCRIVMDPRLAAYGSTDLDGNFIVLRDPSKSILKLNAEGDKVTLV